MPEAIILGACVIALGIIYAAHRIAVAIMYFGGIIGYTMEKTRELAKRGS